MKKTVIRGVAIASVCVLSFVGAKLQKTENVNFSQSLANIQALSQSEGENGSGADSNYHRESRICHFYLEANKRVEVVGYGFATTDAFGRLSIDGEIRCEIPGTSPCTPFDCSNYIIRDAERS